MIAVDTNLLVYAHRRDSELHSPANETLQAVAEGSETWGIPWPCVHEFLAIVTHPRIFDPPSSLADGLGQVDAWLESPTLVLLAERSDHCPGSAACWPKGRYPAAASMTGALPRSASPTG